MKHPINNFEFEIYVEQLGNGFIGCYTCPCGYNHCSTHEESKEMAIITAKGQAFTHYQTKHNKDYKNT